MREWQPLAMLLLALSLLPAARGGRWASLLAAGGLAALWTGGPAGVRWGLLLAGWGLAIDAAAALGAARGIGSAPRWSGAAALVPALAALPAFSLMLGQQVLLSSLAAVLLAAGLAWRARAPAAVIIPP
jgi:hypothetical protein